MNLLLGLLASGLVGTIVFVLLFVIRPITGKLFSQTWHYYSLIVPLAFLLGGTLIAGELMSQAQHFWAENSNGSPSVYREIAEPQNYIEQQNNFVMPENPVFAELAIGAESIQENYLLLTQEHQLFNTEQLLRNITWIAPYAVFFWALGAILFVGISIRKYMKYRRLVLCKAQRYTDIDCKIPIVISRIAHTPMLLGIINPVIIIPDIQLKNKELDVILAHEMTHFRRKDLVYKAVGFIANAIHWYNPAVYALNRQLNILCELSCDEKVVSGMDMQNRRFYGETILQVLKYSAVQGSLAGDVAFATNLCNSKIKFQRRLTSMMNTKKMKKSVAALALITGISVVGGGFVLADMVGSSMLSVSGYSTQNQFNIDVYDFINGVPDDNVISAEAAAQIAADVLVSAFGADLDGVTIQMYYFQSGRISTWAGSGYPKFHFNINAETGGLLSVHYSPWNDEIDITNLRILGEIEPTTQQNNTFSRLAMDIVQTYNILEGAPVKARLVSPFISGDLAVGESAMEVFPVEVQCEYGSIAIISFNKLMENAPVLTSIAVIFEAPWIQHQFEAEWVSREWAEWFGWFDLLTPEEQAYVSLRPSQEDFEPIYAVPVGNNVQTEIQSPYRIAASLEEVQAILALQDGTIPVTNVEVSEIISGQARGIIITEQDLHEALAVLNEVYAQDGYPIRNLTTAWVEISPTFWELPQQVQETTLVLDIVRAALELGLVPSMDVVLDSEDEFARVREEARRLLALYGDGDPLLDGELHDYASMHGVAQRLFGVQE